MAAKRRSPTADFLVYVAARLIVCILQTLPFAWACRLAYGIAWLGYRLDRRHREVAFDNLRHAFPEMHTQDQLDALVRRIYEHFALMLIEILFLVRRVNLLNWHDYMVFRTLEEHKRFVRVLTSGRPVLLATGHFGNWELSSHVLALIGYPVNVIARPIDNPYVDAWLRRFRESQGQTILNKNGDFEKIQAVLARRGVLGTLADQDAGQRGLYVNFFNRPASTHKALALLALEHHVLIVILAAVREGEPLHFRALLEDVIDPDEYEGRPDAVKAITQRYMSALERVVRQYPEQYFWLHRRWKHQPAVKKKTSLAA